MALNMKLLPYHHKLMAGAYDNVLRTLPLFTTVPSLVLVAVDLHRYQKNSAVHHVDHSSFLILDAFLLAFVSFNILWALTWATILRYRQITLRPWIWCVDVLLLTANTGLGDTALSMRSSPKTCVEMLGECTGTARGMMIGVGVLLILSSLPQHILVSGAGKRAIARRRQSKRIKRDMESAEDSTLAAISYENEIKGDVGPAEDGSVISYENEITREMGPAEGDRDITFENEIR